MPIFWIWPTTVSCPAAQIPAATGTIPVQVAPEPQSPARPWACLHWLPFPGHRSPRKWDRDWAYPVPSRPSSVGRLLRQSPDRP